MDEWSNDACLGYALAAADRLGYTEEQARGLMIQLYLLFDVLTVEEAKKYFKA